jgi:hypothetical protein
MQRPFRKEVSIRNISVFKNLKVNMLRFSSLCQCGAVVGFKLIWHGTQWSIKYLVVVVLQFLKNFTRLPYGKRKMLGGYDNAENSIIVEIDESLFFRRKYNRGRYTKACMGFGVVERGLKKCAFFPVPNRSAATLILIIKNNCLPGTTIISDSWAAYRSLSENCNYTHPQVNHSLNFVSPDNPIVHALNIENNWLHAKKRFLKQN